MKKRTRRASSSSTQQQLKHVTTTQPKRAKRKQRTGVSIDALYKAAAKAAAVRTQQLDLSPPGPARRSQIRVQEQVRNLFARVPRQARLPISTAPQRDATVKALQIISGRPIGRATRQKLRGILPETLRATLCAPTRKRRAVMFATGSAGKGKRRAARQPRQQRKLC